MVTPGHEKMQQRRDVLYTWNTMVSSSFWDMRLSIACAATDAEFQNRIILHDNTLNLPAVAQQPHPDPNYAPHAAVRLLAVACPEDLRHEMQHALTSESRTARPTRSQLVFSPS